VNLCRACRHDFASVKAFDRHRIGRHDYTLADGFRRDPPVEHGRRCLDVDEIRAAGMELDRRGRWQLVAEADHVRQVFASRTSAERPQRDAGDPVERLEGVG
jgi:hypothetical protein